MDVYKVENPEEREEPEKTKTIEEHNYLDEKRMLDDIYSLIKKCFDKNDFDKVCSQFNYSVSILNHYEATNDTSFFENSIPLILISLLETQVTEYCCTAIDFISQISKYKEDSIIECFITPDFIQNYCSILTAENANLTSHIISLLEVFGDCSQDFAENLLSFMNFNSLTQYFLFSATSPKQKVDVLKMLYINIRKCPHFKKANDLIVFVEEVLTIQNESDSNMYILLCLIVACYNPENIVAVGSSKLILGFLDFCLESQYTDLQKFALVLYGLFYSDNNCEIPFEFEKYAILTDSDSEVANQAMSVFVYACQNEHCLSTLMENNILDFIRGKEDDSYDLKVLASNALTNLVQSLPCQAHSYLFDAGIIQLLLDFQSTCNNIFFLKSLYFLFTTPDWTLKKSICMQFSELGGTAIVDEIDENNETNQEIFDIIEEIRDNFAAIVSK